MSRLQEEENGRDEEDYVEGGSPVVDEDANTAPDAGCQCKEVNQAPPADPLNVQYASQLHSGYDVEKAKLLYKVNRLQEIAHPSLYNDEAEEWSNKYMKYKGHQETRRITAILQRHFPLFNIAGYNLAQDKIIYVWDVQRRERALPCSQR